MIIPAVIVGVIVASAGLGLVMRLGAWFVDGGHDPGMAFFWPAALLMDNTEDRPFIAGVLLIPTAVATGVNFLVVAAVLLGGPICAGLAAATLVASL